MKPLIIGVTGGIGCGKTTVCDLFAARGASLIDTDLIAHQLTAPHGAAMPAIAQQFGPQYANAQGALDRAKMRELVFADGAAKARLEAILHPMIRRATEQAITAATGCYVMLVVPLLIESGAWQNRVARILVIDCPPETQIERVMMRSQLSKSQVEAIMATQVSRQARLAAADDVIDNQGDLAALTQQIERLHQQYLTLGSQNQPKAG